MYWLYLIIAGLFEIGFTTSLVKVKNTQNSQAVLWFMAFVACLFFSMFFLNKSIKEIPMGTAYAVWTGIGVAGTVLIEIFVFKGSVSFWRLFFLFTLLFSILGLKLVSK